MLNIALWVLPSVSLRVHESGNEGLEDVSTLLYFCIEPQLSLEELDNGAVQSQCADYSTKYYSYPVDYAGIWDNSLMRGLHNGIIVKTKSYPTSQQQEFYNFSVQKKCLLLLELLEHQFKDKIIGNCSHHITSHLLPSRHGRGAGSVYWSLFVFTLGIRGIYIWYKWKQYLQKLKIKRL